MGGSGGAALVDAPEERTARRTSMQRSELVWPRCHPGEVEYGD
jgi:hypothetical protein